MEELFGYLFHLKFGSEDIVVEVVEFFWSGLVLHHPLANEFSSPLEHFGNESLVPFVHHIPLTCTTQQPNPASYISHTTNIQH